MVCHVCSRGFDGVCRNDCPTRGLYGERPTQAVVAVEAVLSYAGRTGRGGLGPHVRACAAPVALLRFVNATTPELHMAFVSLDTEFAQALLKGLDGIDEVNTLHLRQDPELHAMLCDLVGRLATQLQPGKLRHRPINVENLLAEKYVVWDDPTDWPNRRQAKQVLSDRLAIHGRSEDTFSAECPSGAASARALLFPPPKALTWRHEIEPPSSHPQ